MSIEESEIIEPEMIAGNPETRADSSKSVVDRIVIPFAVGDTVVTTTGIYDDGQDYSPPCWLAKKGERLIVRKIYEKSIGVSHHNVTSNHFIVDPHEIRQA